MRVIFPFYIVLLIGLSSCGKKENKFELRYDADNFSAPLLDEGTYTGAVKFPNSELSRFSGKELTKVTFYTLDKPSTCELTVFKYPTDSTFGEVLYSASVETEKESWNTHELSNAIAIPSDEIWLAITFSHTEAASVLGCDAGPAKLNGDWLFVKDSLQTLNNFRSDVDINWNLRGFVK